VLRETVASFFVAGANAYGTSPAPGPAYPTVSDQPQLWRSM
jgi:hypothetical protein